jgi:hypothetical protein
MVEMEGVKVTVRRREFSDDNVFLHWEIVNYGNNKNLLY